MKSNLLLVLICLSILVFSCRQKTKDAVTDSDSRVFEPLSFEEADAKADSVLALMTLDEKIAHLGGHKKFFIGGIERLNLPPIYFADATQGIHLRQKYKDVDLSPFQPERSTAFPAPILLASTWNIEIARQYARSIGEECRAGNVPVLLGPGMNMYRISQCGRNFEYFGEDPFLAARMIENYVMGLQSTGTVATLKHFVANNTDFFRRRSNAIVDERTLHEIYLPAFKAGIDAGATAVMTAYNRLNGQWCGQSNYVITELLRHRLGYKWMVMTDWTSVWDGEKVIESGQDLEMPEAVAIKDAKQLLDDGKIQEADIDRMVKSILRTCFAMRLYDNRDDPYFNGRFEKHVKIALETARQGIVLLRNQGVLPIKTDAANILLTGSFVQELVRGGGAAEVDGYDVVTMLQAIAAEFGDRVRFVEEPTMDELRAADVVLCNIGTEDHEGGDRAYALPADQEARVKMCVENNENTVVIISSGSGVKMTDWNEKAAAILHTWYVGQIGYMALAEILAGKTNPSGKLPISLEKDFKDSPGFGYTGGEQLYTGRPDEKEYDHRLYDIEYNEGVFIGYRWYEDRNIETIYPFGFGMSYTSFEYSDIQAAPEEFTESDEVAVSVTVKNTGNVAGCEIVQLYVQDIESTLDRPRKELKGFARVALQPGESRQIVLKLDKTAFSFWNPETKDWFAEKGDFRIHIGASSADIRLSKVITLL